MSDIAVDEFSSSHDRTSDPYRADIERALVAAEATVATLRALLAKPHDPGSATDPDEWISIPDAIVEFRRSDRQLRRWANECKLGKPIRGRLFLNRALAEKHKARLSGRDV